MAAPELPDSAAGVLTAARDQRRAADAAEVRLLELAVQWVLIHPVDTIHVYGEAATHYVGGTDTELTIAGSGAPQMAEFAVAEFAAAVGLATEAGKRLLGEAVELAYRLPRLWALVRSGRVQAWKARRVAAATICLSEEGAAFVDRQVAGPDGRAGKVGPTVLERLVSEAVARHMPDELQRRADASWDKRHVTVHHQQVSYTGTMHLDADLDIADALDLDAALAAGAAARLALGSTESLDVRRAQAIGDLARGQITLDQLPTTDSTTVNSEIPSTPVVPVVPVVPVPPRQVILYAHLTDHALAGLDPVGRLEHGNTLVTVDQIRSWCASPDTTRITVKPVIDPDQCHALEPTPDRPETGTDSGRVPDRIAEVIAIRDGTCVFPWCTRPARTCDCDHINPHHPQGSGGGAGGGGGGGPTCTCNLAPGCRRHHRLKTHTPWTYVMLDPGTYLWTSPHGYQYLRDPTGTQDITRATTPEP
ncbi:MAG: DUF222 domain-containing protein [Nocardioides sp.]